MMEGFYSEQKCDQQPTKAIFAEAEAFPLKALQLYL